jgi:DNA-binding MarR family transcriptional regulator
MRLGELASQSRVSQPTMSKIVAGLASDDLIRRIADTDDARSWLIASTSKGQRLLADWLTRVADEASSMFDGLSDEEWSTLAAAAAILERGFDSKRAAA